MKRKNASVEEEGFEEEPTEKDAAKKKASIEEEASEEEAMEKDTASNSKLTQWDTAFFGSVAPNEYSIEEEAGDVDVVVDSNATTNQMDCAEQVEEEKAKNAVFRTATKKQLFGPSKRPKGQVGIFLGIAKVAMSLGYKRCV